MSKKRFISEIVCGAVLLTAGLGGGYAYANRNLGVQGELRNARNKLHNCMLSEVMAMGELTTLSEFQLHLANMELYHVRYTIWNQENYASIEKAFQKDEQRWEEDLKKEQAKPSEFEGGSMAPMDHNIRMTSFIEKRIQELKEKWRKK